MTAEARSAQHGSPITPLGWVEHTLAWMPSGELGQWATRNPAVVKIGGHPVRPRRDQRRISRRSRSTRSTAGSPRRWLRRTKAPSRPQPTRSARCGTAGSSARREAEAERRTRAARPDRDRPSTRSCKQVLAAYGAKRLVIAHTPIPVRHRTSRNGGRLARIDTGISRYYGGPLTWLEIVGDQSFRTAWEDRHHEDRSVLRRPGACSRSPRPPAARPKSRCFASADKVHLTHPGAAQRL